MSAEMKGKAREALKGHWQTALLIALIVNLPSLLVQGISAFTDSDLSSRLLTLLTEFSRSGLPLQELLDRIRTILQDSKIQGMQIAGLAASLFTPCLGIGMYCWMLGRLRGEEDKGPIKGAFCRLNCFLKGVGQKILITVKVLLWMLPGMVISFLSLLPVLFAKNAGDLPAALPATMVLSSFGSILMAVLGIRAALCYAMAELLMADKPETGVLASVRESIRIMKPVRPALLALLLSFVGWYLLLLLGYSLVNGIAGPVIGLMVQMLASLALTVYMNTSIAVFYESARKNGE